MAGGKISLAMKPRTLLIYLGLAAIVMINALATENIPNEWPYIRAVLIGIVVIFAIRSVWKRIQKKKASAEQNKNIQTGKPYDEWEQ